MNEYMPKPYKPEELINTLYKVLNTNHVILTE